MMSRPGYFSNVCMQKRGCRKGLMEREMNLGSGIIYVIRNLPMGDSAKL
jgi:hypothetical protein